MNEWLLHTAGERSQIGGAHFIGQIRVVFLEFIRCLRHTQKRGEKKKKRRAGDRPHNIKKTRTSAKRTITALTALAMELKKMLHMMRPTTKPRPNATALAVPPASSKKSLDASIMIPTMPVKPPTTRDTKKMTFPTKSSVMTASQPRERNKVKTFFPASM